MRKLNSQYVMDYNIKEWLRLSKLYGSGLYSAPAGQGDILAVMKKLNSQEAKDYIEWRDLYQLYPCCDCGVCDQCFHPGNPNNLQVADPSIVPVPAPAPPAPVQNEQWGVVSSKSESSMKKLSNVGQAKYTRFQETFGGRQCICADTGYAVKCQYCQHPGNPNNLSTGDFIVDDDFGSVAKELTPVEKFKKDKWW